MRSSLHPSRPLQARRARLKAALPLSSPALLATLAAPNTFPQLGVSQVLTAGVRTMPSSEMKVPSRTAQRRGVWRFRTCVRHGLERMGFLTAACCLALGSEAAQAGYVTLQESSIETIFAQADLAIDLRYRAPVQRSEPGLLDLSRQELNSLGARSAELSGAPVGSSTFTMLFIDTFNEAEMGAAMLGNGVFRTSGNPLLVLESEAANSELGGQLIAQWLGFSMGLTLQFGAFGRLMNPALTLGSVRLTNQEREILLNSPLLQTDADTGQRFLDIQPVAIVSSLPDDGNSVPEPASLALVTASVLGLVAARRKAQAMSGAHQRV